MSGCSSCSTSAVKGIPMGCNNNGACQTGGCGSILDVHDWLSNVYFEDDSVRHHIVEVKFKGTRKEYFRNIHKIGIEIGDAVVVESTMQGFDVGFVSLVGDLVKLQLRKNDLKEDSPNIRRILRRATEQDLEKYEDAKAAEYKTMMRSREIAIDLRLVMKISDVEYQGDKTKATFFYTADGRVDFRELIKQYAREFKVKIEMRQIGLRQEAGRLGGIGSCGRELCCSTWLTDFNSVPTTAAKYQNLFLNPLKLSGQCGRLKCCLNYELDTYLEAYKEFPDDNLFFNTEKGRVRSEKFDILKRIVWFRYLEQPIPKLYPIELDKVWEMIAQAEQGITITELEEFITEVEEVELGFNDVVGEDRLDRFEKKSRGNRNNRNKNQKGRPNNPPQNRGNQPQRGPIKLVDDSNIILNMNENSYSTTLPNQGNRNPNDRNNRNDNRNDNRNNPNRRNNNPNQARDNNRDNRPPQNREGQPPIEGQPREGGQDNRPPRNNENRPPRNNDNRPPRNNDNRPPRDNRFPQNREGQPSVEGQPRENQPREGQDNRPPRNNDNRPPRPNNRPEGGNRTNNDNNPPRTEENNQIGDKKKWINNRGKSKDGGAERKSPPKKDSGTPEPPKSE